MLELPPDIMVSDVLVIMDVFVGSPGPDEEHGESPYEEEDEEDACADEELVGDVVTGKVADVDWEGLHGFVFIMLFCSFFAFLK